MAAPRLLDDIRKAIDIVRPHVRDLDPARCSTDDAAKVVALFAEVERIGAAGKLLFAPRAAEGRVWKEAGHRSAASWLAQLSGGSAGEAMALLETAERLSALPDTADAVRRGELSAAQTKEIAGAAIENPAAERDLIEAAANDSLRRLKDKAARAKAAGSSQLSIEQREERLHKARYLKSWVDPEGGVRIDALLAPVAGAAVIGALDAEATKRFEAARLAGIEERSSAYLADALVELITRPGGDFADRRVPTVSLLVDLPALRRGALEDGEVCEIPGVGPVSLASANGLLGDSFLKLLVTNGVDVSTVAHGGRTIPAHVRSALEVRDPTCVVPGCGIAYSLEIHHLVPFAQGGPSTLPNLVRLCTAHHRMLTHGGFKLVGGPGKWELCRTVQHDRAADGRDPPPNKAATSPVAADGIGNALQFDDL